MQTIEVKKLSPAQLYKFRKGKPVRITQGSGINITLSPEKHSKLLKSFQKGRASTVALSADEIEANKMGGSGLFAGGKINTKPLQNVLGVLKKAGENAGKPFEKTVKVNPFTLGYDLGHDVIAPELKKSLKGGKLKVPKGLQKFGTDLGKDVAKQAAKEIVKEGVKSAFSGEGIRKRKLGKRLGDKHIKSVTKELGRAGKQILKEVILPEGKKALTQAIRNYSQPSAEAEAVPFADVIGGEGLYAGASSNVYRGSGLVRGLSGISILPPDNPNVRSQPQFVNPVTSIGRW